MDVGKPEKVTTEEPPSVPIPAPNFVPVRREVEVPDWMDPNKVAVPVGPRRREQEAEVFQGYKLSLEDLAELTEDLRLMGQRKRLASSLS